MERSHVNESMTVRGRKPKGSLYEPSTNEDEIAQRHQSIYSYTMTTNELIEKAVSVTKPYASGDFASGGVGCALVTKKGNVYTGVCIDTSSSMGYCAEHNAIGSMITDGEYEIEQIVAVWKDGKKLHILSPCGRCRAFMFQVDNKNLETKVVLSSEKVVPLKELLPYADWCELI